MKPQLSYRVWMSQRNGSTFYCKSLEQTGLAGIPNEWFNTDKSLCETYSCDSYEMLRNHLWSIGSSNGVFGIKHSNITYRMDQIIQELCDLRGEDPNAPGASQKQWDDLFPNCKHIFLTRRDKIRQAVSWWKAIHDQKWHLEHDEVHKNPASFYEEKYNFDALMHLWKETNLRESTIQEYFNKQNIIPLTFVYEDFVQDINGTVQQTINFLGIEYNEISFGAPFYRKIAD